MDEFPGAEPFIPPIAEVSELARAADQCRGCPLFKDATQAVFGEGPARSKVMLIGEQPGDKEDLSGHPFVGPAGRILDEALAAAGITRASVYLTNAVKHFKFRASHTGRRLHAKPNRKEMRACLPWLKREMSLICPDRIGCLGATAAQQIFGPQFRITRDGGKAIRGTAYANLVVATIHPSAVLRMRTSSDRAETFAKLVSDLRLLMETEPS